MPEFPYTTVPGKLGPLLDKIRHTGVPAKATAAWLKSIGFTSSNDTTLLPLLKFIGLCDQSGSPGEHWKQYRGSHHGTILAQTIREGYTELFGINPQAQQQADSDLTSFFTTRSKAGKQVISKTVTTFKTLCSKADFQSPLPSTPDTIAPPTQVHQEHKAPAPAAIIANPKYPTPEVHIDIQIHISPEATPAQIDQIFKSMSKHLYGRDDK